MPNFRQQIGDILNSIGLRSSSEHNLGTSSPASAGRISGTPGSDAAASIASAISSLNMTLQPLVQQIQMLTTNMQMLTSSMQQARGGVGAPAAGGAAVTPSGAVVQPAMGGGGGGFNWGNVLSNAQWSGFHPQAVLGATISELPGLYGGLAAAGMLFANTTAASFQAYSAPIFQTQTGLMAAARSGQYINPIESGFMQRGAELQGRLGAARAWGGLGDWLGPVGAWNENRVYRPLERQIAMEQANGMHAMMNLRLAAWGGVPDLDLNDNTLQFQYSGVRAAAGFGRSATRAYQDLDYGYMARRGYTPEEVGAAVGTVAGYAGQARYGALRTAMMGGNAAGANAMALSLAAGRGDLGAIAGLTPLFAGNPGALDMASGLANNALNTIAGLQIGQSGLTAGYAGLDILRNSGAGYRAIQGQTGAMQGGIQSQIALLNARRIQLAGDPVGQAEIDAQIMQLAGAGAGLYRLGAETEYGQRGTALSAGGLSASIGTQAILYGGGDAGALAGGFGAQASIARRQARLLREQAGRSDIYDPATRALFGAQAGEAEFNANVLIPRQLSFETFGIASGRAGLAGAAAGEQMTRATLFGGAGDIRKAGESEAASIRQQIAAINDLLSRGNLSLKEQLQYQTEITNLRKQEVQVTQEAIRGAARQTLEVAGMRTGTAGMEAQIGFMQGTGGVAGVGLQRSVVSGRQNEITAAQAYIKTLQQQGVSEDNPEMVAARQALAGARLGETEAEIGMGRTPLPMGLQRQLSALQYQTQALSMFPGSYGNLRGALQGQLGALGQARGVLQQQYQEAMRNASPENREAIAFEFQKRMQDVGLQEAGVYQQLSYGWESRLVSAAMGAPGNFGMLNMRFSPMAAVLGGVRNPHFGSNLRDLPSYLSMAAYPGSMAGAPGTPEGFAATAMTGAHGQSGFALGVPGSNGRMVMRDIPGVGRVSLPEGARIGYMPEAINPYKTADGSWHQDTWEGTNGTAAPSNRPNFSAANPQAAPVQIEITLKWPDGSEAGRAKFSTTPGGSSILNTMEDAVGMFVRQAQGNN